MIQAIWKKWIEANPTNNISERKARRLGFYAGIDAYRDHLQHAERLGLELDASYSDASLTLVVDND